MVSFRPPNPLTVSVLRTLLSPNHEESGRGGLLFEGRGGGSNRRLEIYQDIVIKVRTLTKYPAVKDAASSVVLVPYVTAERLIVKFFSYGETHQCVKLTNNLIFSSVLRVNIGKLSLANSLFKPRPQ